ncbi:MAG: NAD(P)/FAD-dependent oxidoreductase [Bacteroidales bacterium]|nr:NAD(P)/FAD-dependent oxidoreductase [Bacteroidales bacterium]
MTNTIKNNISGLPADKKYDVVIIGAGIGGLTAAALLAKSRLKVCVVEMAPHPGGYLTGFERNGFHFETSIHWLNQCGPDGFVRRIFNLIAPGSPPTAENTRIRRFLSDSYDYLLTNDPDEMRDDMISHFRDEEKAIRKFFKAGKSTAGAFTKMSNASRSGETMSALEKARSSLRSGLAAMPLIRYLPFSAKMGMNRFFRSSGLKKLYSTEERLLSCLVPIGWAYSNDYQLPPQGGGRAFTDWITDVLKKWETPVFCNSRVNKIMIENEKASGVSCIYKGEEFNIHAKYVIAACDVESVYTAMLPEGTVSGKMIRKLQNAEVFNSCVTISLGLDCKAADLGLDEEQVLIRRNDISRKEQLSGAPDKTEISVIATSSRDPSAAPEGKGVLTLFASCDIEYGDFWKTKRDDDGNYVRGSAYRAFKKEYADIMIDRVEEMLIPGLRSHIEVLDISTPVTYLRYTGNRDGAIMGFRPNFRNIRKGVAHISTPVKNLFIGGQWAELGGGIPNAVKAGMNSALLVIKDEKPETFKILAMVIDGKLPPEQVSSAFLRKL